MKNAETLRCEWLLYRHEKEAELEAFPFVPLHDDAQEIELIVNVEVRFLTYSIEANYSCATVPESHGLTETSNSPTFGPQS